MVVIGKHHARLSKPGTASLALSLSKAQERKLKGHRRFKLKVTIVYVPALGPRITTKRTVTIKP
jgi:hypothetical protein